MMQLSLYFLLMIFSITFIQMNHPLAMGLMILIQTTFVCIYTGMMAKTFWFSYILFLIFLGGMLVLFIYTTSLASNEMFSFSIKLLLTMMIIFMMLMSISMFFDKSLFMSMFNNIENNLMDNFKNFNKENSINLSKLYNYPTNFSTILLMNYLLITLIASVKITNLFFGPLRMSN